MASLQKKTIEHFTHPNHQLLEIRNDDEYLCNGCNTFGIGTGYRCHGCDFDRHEYCGTCPTFLSSFMHSQRLLALLVHKPEATRQNDRTCHMCGHSVEGLFYRCNLCEFDAHPLCTQLSQQVQHFLHPAHPLTLQPFPPNRCLVCKNNCTSWRYRCNICCIDIHLDCLSTACDASTSTSTPTPVPRSVWQPTAPAAAPPPPVPRSVSQPRVPAVAPPPPVPRSVWSPSAPAAAPPPAFGPCEVPQFVIPYPYRIQAPPFAAYNYPYGVPFGFSPSNMYHQHPLSGNQQVGGGRFRKKMYKLVGNLTLGVLASGLSNAALFGI